MTASRNEATEIELDRTPTPEEEVQEFFNLEEQRNYVRETQELQIERLRDENSGLRSEADLLRQGMQDNLELRKEYAKKSWWLACCWAIFSGIMTLLQFCKPFGKHLDVAEFIAIVATALATIIALYVQVGKGMFRNSE